MKEFYLVRTPNTYHNRKACDGFPQGKLDTMEEAQQVAVDLATQTRQTQLVYRVVLVGKAAIQEAVYTPQES